MAETLDPLGGRDGDDPAAPRERASRCEFKQRVGVTYLGFGVANAKPSNETLGLY